MNNFKEFSLEHIAVAVKDLEKSVQLFTLLGLNFSDKREVVESQKVKTAFADLDSGHNAHLELLMPTSEDSTIHQFIQKKGEGIHHLCFRVSDVHKKCEELKAQGIRLIYPSPVPGANQTLVNFIHPQSANGILVEIAERKENT